MSQIEFYRKKETQLQSTHELKPLGVDTMHHNVKCDDVHHGNVRFTLTESAFY